MERTDYTQLELFSQIKDYAETKIRSTGKSFFSYVRNYEKAILIVIGLLITGIVAFSLGVERGKRLASLNNVNRIIDKQGFQTVPSNINPSSIIPPLKIPAQPTTGKPQDTKQPQPKNSQENFTIQLASYQSRISAQKEAEKLKKKGLPTLILSKGKYTVLCVGNFSDREKARSILSELKKQKRYADSFIRRL
jgi:hypothetical protein